MVREPLKINRRQLLQGACGSLGLALLGSASPKSYEVITIGHPAAITGTVRYAGRAGPPPRVKLSGDCAYCRRFDLRDEELLQHANGGLQNVAVFLAEVTRGKEMPAHEPTLAEKRCTFVPHVLCVTAGQKLRLLNVDPVLNTFHAVEMASGRTLFNIGMPQKNQQALRRIRQPGVIKMLCDVHPWEVGYLLALPHPYHTVTDPRGRFQLEQVPPGTYRLQLWHEKLGELKKTVSVSQGAQLKLDLVYPKT